ncbi:MAG: sugar phosphate isomerase/epimerase family protein [Planctomycetota bacterium]|jgi:sugar phosphate isomerase/epimerase
MKKISIGSWAYTIGPYADNAVAWEEVIKKLAELGFDGVELGGFPPHPNPDDMPDRQQRDACKQQVADLGLGWSGLAANLWSQHLIDTDDNSAYIDCFRQNLQFCVDLGIPAIRVDCVQPPTIFETVDPDTALQRVVETWKICAADAADAGIRMAWEFEPGFAFNKPSDIVRIVEQVSCESSSRSVTTISV